MLAEAGSHRSVANRSIGKRLVHALGTARAEEARRLTYRLHTVVDRRGWSEHALAYNGLVASGPHVTKHAPEPVPAEEPLF